MAEKHASYAEAAPVTDVFDRIDELSRMLAALRRRLSNLPADA